MTLDESKDALKHARDKYGESVFINCPFDARYKPLFHAVVFSVFDCGFVARCAMEEDDGSQIRVQRIYNIISQCRLGIHDLSRIELSRETRLPRFNMPLELGAFLGAKYFGGNEQRRKACLILDSDKYRYQRFISDIAGQDIQAHRNSPRKVVPLVRNWLVAYSQDSMPSGSIIWERYAAFGRELPLMCKKLRLNPKEMIYNDYVQLVSKWLKLNE